MTLVLIEGIDRSGKSTLAERLARELNADVWHFGPPEQDAIDEYVEPILRREAGFGNAGAPPLVLDRGHIGEAVWPRFFGRGPRMTRLERQWIELFMLSRGAVYVLAHRDLDGLLDAWRKADEAGEPEPLDRELIPDAQQAYQLEFEESGPPFTNYVHDEDGAGARQIAEYAQNTADFARPGLRHRQWIGNHRPKVMYAMSGLGPLGLPQPAPGGKFARAMDAAGDAWREVAIVHPLVAKEMHPYLGWPETRTAAVAAGS